MDHSPRFLKLCENVRTHIAEVSVDDVHARLTRGDKFHLIDVREDREWDAGHIKGASHMGRGVLERDIEKVIPDAHAEIVLYCGGGFRSALAAESLAKMGYTRVLSMAGGWREWTGKNLPTE